MRFSLLLSLFVLLQTFYPISGVLTEEISIGSKSFTEQVLLGEILAQLIEADGEFTVRRRFHLGGSMLVFDALKSGEIDIYPEYTGTGLVNILNLPAKNNPQEVFALVKKEFKKQWDLDWLPSFGFNNTYILAVHAERKPYADLKTVSELHQYASKLRFGCPHEFLDRPDGLKGMLSRYNFSIPPSNVITLDAGLMYSAIDQNEVDVITAYSTDGRIKAFNLTLLKDDLMFFPPYEAAPLVRGETLRRYPQLQPLLEKLAGSLPQQRMLDLNYEVDSKKRPAKIVAREFLTSTGLLEESTLSTAQGQVGSTSLIEFFWKRKTLLARLTGRHLLLTFIALFAAVLLALPLGIASTRNKSLVAPVFGFLNIVQTIPSLALLGFMIPVLGIGIVPAITALFLYALLPLVRNTYTGIKEIDRNLILSAKGLGLTNRQILFKVELPLALPVIMAGVRTSAVILIGTATLAALIGAGGLGEPIFRGIASVNNRMILLGAVPAALLAVFADRLLYFAEQLLASRS